MLSAAGLNDYSCVDLGTDFIQDFGPEKRTVRYVFGGEPRAAVTGLALTEGVAHRRNGKCHAFCWLANQNRER